MRCATIVFLLVAATAFAAPAKQATEDSEVHPALLGLAAAALPSAIETGGHLLTHFIGGHKGESAEPKEHSTRPAAGHNDADEASERPPKKSSKGAKSSKEKPTKPSKKPSNKEAKKAKGSKSKGSESKSSKKSKH